ncbi:unnamed protein product [Penicillium salamii]|uniref:Uncharacterized protein n=1 Tax=Penicillium salamii TaxID=1612424 RepID=A0A9W4NS50_9EURO|nr:unnamed protein product [Penicillium salamii]CAG8382350.1 unnamed protein product [Penicillium salamii]CAG8388341.1 unnamed protein product [Penicillium salamii]CAG8400528.1 unnamed protein product [Penicillium salamii]
MSPTTRFGMIYALLTTIGLRAAPGQTAANHASGFLIANWVWAFCLMSNRGAKVRLGIDNNVCPWEDLTTFGEAAVQAGKISRSTLNKPKRREAAHANAQEGYPLFVAAILISLFAGVPNETINTIGLWYTISSVAYSVLYTKITSKPASFLRSVAWRSGNISCIYGLIQANKKL